jgi:hypothetical protein
MLSECSVPPVPANLSYFRTYASLNRPVVFCSDFVNSGLLPRFPGQADLPFPILGVVAAQFLMMHFVEIRRWRDFVKPGSMDSDPLFPGNSLPKHEVGYPGGIFDPFGTHSPIYFLARASF